MLQAEAHLKDGHAVPGGAAGRPVGVFDSGIGGLSILQALRAQMPGEDFVYVADSGHAPYGERDNAQLVARSSAIANHLRTHHGIKALVVACNTATAAAIDQVRQEYPGLPIVGVEPALKPAVAVSHTKRIGVMATRSTLASARFAALLGTVNNQAEFVCQPCDGLADAIEVSVQSQDATELIAICARYTGAIGQFGCESGLVDTLVLGCTHYPFAIEHLRALTGPAVAILSTGEPVARQTLRLLENLDLLNGARSGQTRFATTGRPELLGAAAARWLDWHGEVEVLSA